jgi:4-hydroxy-4-methyl-2-oxoglutarate aldolase
MTLERREAAFRRLTQTELETWEAIPTTIASDSMNRTRCMDSAIKPLHQSWRVVGQARTVLAMPGDNSMVHVACSIAGPGDVVVVDGSGLSEVAMAGHVICTAAKRRGIRGLIIDGTARDGRELIELGWPLFARGLVPRGPHKNFGGTMDAPISVGGVAVKPGDIVLGDIDGVCIVPLEIADEVIEKCRQSLDRENDWYERLERGDRLADIFHLEIPPAQPATKPTTTV